MCQRPPPEPPAAAEPVAPGSIPELFHCDTLYLTLEAQGRAPVDIGLFFMDTGFKLRHYRRAGYSRKAVQNSRASGAMR
jgi:hypothetical protein